MGNMGNMGGGSMGNGMGSGNGMRRAFKRLRTNAAIHAFHAAHERTAKPFQSSTFTGTTLPISEDAPVAADAASRQANGWSHCPNGGRRLRETPGRERSDGSPHKQTCLLKRVDLSRLVFC